MRPTLLLVGLCAALTGLVRAETPDNLSYPDDQTAQAAWKALEDSPPVTMATVDGRRAIRFPCSFKTLKAARAYWDHAVTLDLTTCRGLEFRILCRNSRPFSGFTVYLRSGGGWYRKSIETAREGWALVRVDKADVEMEGVPAGWGRIETIRIAGWRALPEDTEFFVADLARFGADAPLAVVRNESAAKDKPGELGTVAAQCALTGRILDELGLPYNLLSDVDLTPERLKSKQIVILPFTAAMSDEAAGALARFMQDGGKLIGFYFLPDKVRQAAGLEGGRWIGQKPAGYFSSIRPVAPDALKDAPPVVSQHSWNVCEFKPAAGRGRVVANWFNEKGGSTGDPAIVTTDNAIVMTHIMLPDDLGNKQRLLLAMLGHFRPEMWKTAAQATLDRLGRFGSFESFEQAERTIRESPAAAGPLAKAVEARAKAKKLLAEGKTAEVLALTAEAQDALLTAYAAAQRPLAGEHRAFWCHSPLGVAGMTWDEAVALLARNGYTDLHPNMLWGGSAAYDSKVLSRAPGIAGDPLAECLAACKKYGIACHVWKVNWNGFGKMPDAFRQRIKQEGRGQLAFDGKAHDDWLCPSHPANQQLEIDAMVELATRFDVDGIHFDYIRYPGPEYCFCAGCRERFEKAIGQTVARWPADARQDAALRAKWLDFRRAQITKVVTGVSAAVRQAKPKVKISAAVFPNWATDRDGVGQDWKLWCEKGYLDFVCPMDYVEESVRFENLVAQQAAWAGKVPCYPGIGISTWPVASDGNLCELISQVNVTRRLKTGGFTIFEYAAREAKEIVPRCGLGLTSKD
jgi:uncharacterized lipoprotein YddW (UPF0748 family)